MTDDHQQYMMKLDGSSSQVLQTFSQPNFHHSPTSNFSFRLLGSEELTRSFFFLGAVSFRTLEADEETRSNLKRLLRDFLAVFTITFWLRYRDPASFPTAAESRLFA
jgi:hypothetical protein